MIQSTKETPDQWFCSPSSLKSQVLILQGNKYEVTNLCPSPDGGHLAVGYEDGTVRIFSLLSGESSVSFSGHKSAVTAIKYDGLGARLVTGSRVRWEKYGYVFWSWWPFWFGVFTSVVLPSGSVFPYSSARHTFKFLMFLWKVPVFNPCIIR